jgi:ribosomal protein S18 acetylase RimI-like enzyme
MPNEITILDYRPEFGPALVPMWRASFEHGVGARVPHSIEEHRRYFEDSLLVDTTVHVALKGGELAGFIASTPAAVMQLYVDVEHLGQGIGTRLLELAKARSDGTLWLYTFATNTRAQRFYEHHGFDIVARGFEPVMQLDDIRYEWQRGVQRPR